MTTDRDAVRQQFPGLERSGRILMDNAGGSQTLDTVIERITHYLTECDVQLGASYPTSQEAARLQAQAIDELCQLTGTEDQQQLVLGGSTTLLLRILSQCLARTWQTGDEVIITEADHEANVSCWLDLARMGIVIRVWPLDPISGHLDLNDLEPLLNRRTRLVAVCHVSNVTGTITPIEAVAEAVHDAGALLAVDGVAYAPHRAIDFERSAADFYVFSGYKVFGPHIAVLLGRRALLEALPGLNHRMIDTVPYKFQPGGVNYELAYGFGAVGPYVASLGSSANPADTTAAIRSGFDWISERETALIAPLIDWIAEQDLLTLHGVPDAAADRRVATVAFSHRDKHSQAMVAVTDQADIGIRHGDFYATELINRLGLRAQGGPVRISLCHYNTEDEVERLIEVLSSAI